MLMPMLASVDAAGGSWYFGTVFDGGPHFLGRSGGQHMAMELKQHLRLSQQLVMTPQLQQAIKLLQLSRLELVDLVRAEMEENPVLEDGVEAAQEQPREADAETRAENQIQRENETPVPSDQPRDT